MSKPLRYAGSKSRVLPQILPILASQLAYRTHFVDAFCGSGAVSQAMIGHALWDPCSHNLIMIDANESLMSTYECMASQPTEVIRNLTDILGEWNRRTDPDLRKAWYLHQRVWFNSNRDEYDESTVIRLAAVFIFLNMTSFNGVWRVNANGDYNVPCGRKGPFTHAQIDSKLEAWMDFNKVLSCATLHTDDVTDENFIYGHFNEESHVLWYFDPPYHTDNGGLTKYQSGWDNIRSHVALADLADHLDPKHSVALSNADTPFVRELYKGWNIHEIQAHRSVSSKASTRGTETELLITNF